MGLLRLLLALCVVVHHTPGSAVVLTNGGIAVQAFYVISGFFIAMVLTGKYHTLPAFYANRGLRLFPVYLLVLLLAAAQFFAAGENMYLRESQIHLASEPVSAAALIASNFLLIGQEWIVWFDLDPATGALTPDLAAAYGDGRIPAWHFLLLPQAWTLSLELAFYAIAPFVVKRRIMIIVALALFSLAVRSMWSVVDIDYNLWVRRMFASEMCLFLLGVLAFRLREPIAALAGRRVKVVGAGALAGMIALIGLHNTLFGASSFGRVVLVLMLAGSLPFIHATLGRAALDRRIGDLSYPVYIVHILMIATIQWLAPGWLHPAFTVAASLAGAVLLYLMLDRPVDMLRQRIARSSAGSIARGRPPRAPEPPRLQTKAPPA